VGRRDLAGNLPGQGISELAVAARRAAPVKTFLGRFLGVHTDERALRVGASGEKSVGKRLARLGPEWRVIHSIPAGRTGRDIDHLVIGPGGVFSLNTKNHLRKKVWVAPRTFRVGGYKTDYLPKSHKEGAHASRVLSKACGFDIAVEPVIIVIATSVTVKEQPRDVHVVRRKNVTKWLSSRPPVLTPEGVEIVYEQARWSTTWLPPEPQKK
jgi:hypothetical protein